MGAAVIAFQRDLSFARSLNGLRRTVEEGHAWGCVGKSVVLFSMILCSVLGAQWCLGLPTLLHAETCAKFPALVKLQDYSDSVCSVLRTCPIYFSWLEKSVFDNGTVLACVRMSAFVICDIILTFTFSILLRCPACHALSFLAMVGVIHEYSSPYKIIGLNIYLENISFMFVIYCCVSRKL